MDRLSVQCKTEWDVGRSSRAAHMPVSNGVLVELERTGVVEQFRIGMHEA
jgi:hypothetical protein